MANRGGDLPSPFLVVGGKLHQGKKPIIGEGGGPLGNTYDPFRLEYDPASGTKIPALQLPKELTPERMTDRQKLLDAFGRAESRAATLDAAGKLDEYRSRALAMLTSPTAAGAFDLSKEKPATADRYGRTRFGQSCLLARRLVEAGVRFVTVSYGGWDMHAGIENAMRRQAPGLDSALAGLVRDLSDRGLLASTIVLVTSEFGRTPKINASAGRDHFPRVFSLAVAGGGFKPGLVYGSSNATASEPEDNPVRVEDVLTTVYHQLGINADKELMAPGGRPIEIIDGGEVVKGLLA